MKLDLRATGISEYDKAARPGLPPSEKIA